MNVLHLSTAITWRGGEQQIAYLHKGLQEMGVGQTVICSSKSALQSYCNKYSVNNYHIPKKGSWSLAYARKIKEVVVKHGVDIIHVHDSHAHNNAVLAASLYRVNVPIVLHRRVDFAVSNNMFSRYKYNHAAIKRIISVSRAIQEVLAPAIADKVKLQVVYSGVDTTKAYLPKGRLHQELGLSTDALIVGNTAALADHKDPFTFLKVADALKDHPKFVFVWIGGGELETDVKDAITRMGLEGKVRLLGFRADVRELVPDFSFFLMTSETEGLGTSILDAFLAGVPVVATAAGGIPELVTHGQTGLLAPVKDADTLAMHLLHLAVDGPYAQRLSEQAKQKAASFDFHYMAAQVKDIYQEILG